VKGRGGSEAVAASSAERQHRQHSAAQCGFKPIQTESKIFQMDSKFSKFWLIQKVPLLARKIGKKIWLEIA
jgi:hypothetical protein